MSAVRLDWVWRPESVLPYLFKNLWDTVEKISPIYGIYLYGSRSKLPYADWSQLAGKDWDVLMVCNFPIVNTGIWTRAIGYHIDLSIVAQKDFPQIKKRYRDLKQLYPTCEVAGIQRFCEG